MRTPSARVGLSLAIATVSLSHAPGGVAAESAEACFMRKARVAPDDAVIGDLRAACAQETADTGEELHESPITETYYEASAIAQRMALDRLEETEGFQLTPHRPNYIVYSIMDDANQDPYLPVVEEINPVADHESVFQISFKAPVARDLFGTGLDAYFAYTSRAWWQVANDDFSSPFRETNYQPELLLRYDRPSELLGLPIEAWSISAIHESNGREEPLSRSWNRLEGRAGFQLTPELSLLAQAWYRFPEDNDNDDNPNMEDFRGYGDLRAIWTPNRSTFTGRLNPAGEGLNFELTWSYPISPVFRLYASYYDGHGESLIDYDFEIQRFSLGIALNDYLAR